MTRKPCTKHKLCEHFEKIDCFHNTNCGFKKTYGIKVKKIVKNKKRKVWKVANNS